MPRAINFSAGPAVLPDSVLRQAADEMLDWHGSGMSVMEMSHRGKEFIAIHAEAEALLRELLAVPANYKVLFMQGGAIGENAIVPMNMMRGKAGADYIHTGEWSKKSIAEAKKYGKVNVAASGEASRFTSIPARATWQLDPGAAYVHICSNETIGGVEYHFTPEVGDVPLVADMSSDILSRPIEVAKYGLIYAGAQKNIGPAGLTIVIVRDDLIGHAHPFTPSAFDYKQQADDDSMLNTPPTYAIYIAGLVFELDQVTRRPGGDGRAQPRQGAGPVRLPRPQQRSSRNPVARADRSLMNVPFKLKDEALDDAFLKGAQARGMVQLKGHRSVGGMRASIYNAMPIEGVRGAGGLHAGVRGRAWLSKLGILVVNQISRGGARRACPTRRYVVGKDIERSGRDPGPLGRPARAGDPDERARDRPRRRGHQQHPGRGDERARRAGLQRARRQRQRRQGAGARRHADGGAPDRAGAALRRRARPGSARSRQGGRGRQEGVLPAIELAGQTLGIIGLGKIGCLVADAAIKLGMKVLGFDPDITVDAAWSLPSQVRRAASVNEVLRQAQFVTLHVPLIDATRHLINDANIGLMRPGAVLLNFSREGVVGDKAVLDALAAGRLGQYVCDFPGAALHGQAHVIALPHLGASTREAEDNCAVMVVDQLRDYLEHGNVINAVNFPQVTMARESAYRVAIANANVPNMLGQISTAMAQGRTQHPQHGEQVARRDGVHAGRRRQPGAAGSAAGNRGDRRRARGALPAEDVSEAQKRRC